MCVIMLLILPAFALPITVIYLSLEITLKSCRYKFRSYNCLIRFWIELFKFIFIAPFVTAGLSLFTAIVIVPYYIMMLAVICVMTYRYCIISKRVQ